MIARDTIDRLFLSEGEKQVLPMPANVSEVAGAASVPRSPERTK